LDLNFVGMIKTSRDLKKILKVLIQRLREVEAVIFSDTTLRIMSLPMAPRFQKDCRGSEVRPSTTDRERPTTARGRGGALLDG
jgi:hypothetical protein